MNKWGLVRGFSCISAFANLSLAALASAQCPEDVAAQLKACASIDGPTESLACFKQLAGRAGPSLAAPPIAAPPIAAPPLAAPPLAAPSAAPAGAVAAPVSQPSPVVVPKESFGLHAAEHPAAPKTEPSHTGKIIALGKTISGRPTVTLEGEELWELDVGDPLLGQGDSVTITRGTFGSFLLTTPTGRTHRVQRLH